MAPLVRAAETYGVVTFQPINTQILEWPWGSRASVRVSVGSGKGSATIETSDPFMYYDPDGQPDPNYVFPCGIGTPGEIAGLSYASGARVFNFGNRAYCRQGGGYYLFKYKARVTDNYGAHPSSTTFRQMIGYLTRLAS